VKLGAPDWSESSHALAYTVTLQGGRVRMHAMLNAYWEALDFEMPHGRWRDWVNTAKPSPDDILDFAAAVEVASKTYRVEPRSVVLLISRVGSG
ncbi:MAG TPA: glycogen debranching enzyme, partial [Planctomycetota bacterium]|nr:glycogen debranching enzyme [Planctomycetota bacterium]